MEDFNDPEIIAKMQENRRKLEERFKEHPQPVMRGLIDTLLADAPTGCVLLGQRNVQQVEAAAVLGDILEEHDADWVSALYS